METNQSETRVVNTLQDQYGNIIFTRSVDNQSWKTPYHPFINYQFTHCGDQSKPLDFQQITSPEQPKTDIKILFDDNDYFCGFGELDAGVPSPIDVTKRIDYGWPEQLQYWPNRHTPLQIYDKSEKSPEERIVAWRSNIHQRFWNVTSQQQWKFTHIEKGKWIGFNRNEDNENPAKVKKVSLKFNRAVSSEWHRWHFKQEKDAKVASTALKHIFKAPFKSIQNKNRGDCIQKCVNNILGARYWTNEQYYNEFVKPYDDTTAKRRELSLVPGKFSKAGYEDFDEISIIRALGKVGAFEQRLENVNDLRKINFSYPSQCLGIRVTYSAPQFHSVAFRFVDGYWWFIQSWRGHLSQQLANKEALIQKIKLLLALSVTQGTVNIVRLRPDAKTLIPPDFINRIELVDITTEKCITYFVTDQEPEANEVQVGVPNYV